MTDQEQNLQRLQAWDTYQATKKTFLACRAKLTNWSAQLHDLSRKMASNPLAVIEQDANLIPNQQIFINAVQELGDARVKFERARTEAMRFNWPVDQKDSELLH